MTMINNYANEMYNCKDGTWFDVLYTYKYGNESYEVIDNCCQVYADSEEDAITRFFVGDELQGITKKSDDFCNRVLNIMAYAR